MVRIAQGIIGCQTDKGGGVGEGVVGVSRDLLYTGGGTL